jgi:hypothetical protein
MPYSVREPTFMSSESFLPAGAHNQTDVYAVHGADPEVLAYAMAKYSRSALSMRESLTEISAPSNSSIHSISNTAIVPSPTSLTSPSPSRDSAFWRLSSL